jgi:hypothetical protein
MEKWQLWEGGVVKDTAFIAGKLIEGFSAQIVLWQPSLAFPATVGGCSVGSAGRDV